MEFRALPPQSLHVSPSIFSDFADRIRRNRNFNFSSILAHLFSVVLTFCFAFVGTLLGFMTGALIGQETESGFVRGAAIGAISGAVFALEVFESSVLLWRSDGSGIQCLLYLIDVISSLLSGRLVRERIGPAMLSAVQSQMGATEPGFDEISYIFDVGGDKGLSGDMVDKIPIVKITMEDTVDSTGYKVPCSVCLQDFQVGEAARRLPHCRHTFHLSCIDRWLLKHGSCPLCRRDL